MLQCIKMCSTGTEWVKQAFWYMVSHQKFSFWQHMKTHLLKRWVHQTLLAIVNIFMFGTILFRMTSSFYLAWFGGMFRDQILSCGLPKTNLMKCYILPSTTKSCTNTLTQGYIPLNCQQFIPTAKCFICI